MLLADLPVVTPDAVVHLPQDTKPGGRCWWLLWTEIGREKRLAASLNEEGAVPLIITNTRVFVRFNGAGRRFRERREVALFPGYTFANGTADQIYASRAKQRAQVTNIVQQARTAQQIARVHEVSMACEDLTSVKIEPGRWVQVVHGPFTGKMGIVSETRPGVVCLPVETLGRGVPLEIPMDFVEPV